MNIINLKDSYTNVLFFFFLVMSFILSISSNSMLWMWLSMELNIIMVLPLISIDNNLKSMEQTMKYFIIQSVSSNMLLMSMFFLKLILELNMSLLTKTLMTIVIMFKMGSAPFHFWMVKFLKKMSWMNMFIMLSLQKIIPFILLILLNEKSTLIMFLLINSMFGSFMGLNQLSLRKILLFSSLAHMSWMFLSMILSMKMFKFYFFLYLTMNFSMCYLLHEMKLNYVFQSMKVFSISKKDENFKYLPLFMMILFFMGLPPMIGFFPKFLIIMKSSYSFFSMMIVLIMMNLISMAFYSRVMLNFLMNSKYMNKMEFKFYEYSNKKFYKFINLITNYLMLSMMIYVIYKIF